MRDIALITRYIGLALLAKGYSLTPTKLQKILYYVQAWFMVYFEKERIFNDEPQAWVNGPVYPEIYNQYKHLNRSALLTPKDFEADDIDEAYNQVGQELQLTLSPDQLSFIDSVLELYGSKSEDALVFLSHAEAPWSEAREGYEPFERSTKPISLDRIYDYYKARKDRKEQKQA